MFSLYQGPVVHEELLLTYIQFSDAEGMASKRFRAMCVSCGAHQIPNLHPISMDNSNAIAEGQSYLYCDFVLMHSPLFLRASLEIVRFLTIR